MQVDFYHLERTPLERVLPSICEKVLAGGERLLIVAEPGLLGRLDGQLWSYVPESFLPHGTGDGAAPDRQPILLSSAMAAANGASHVAIADGQWRDEALGFARAFLFFDNDARDRARAVWRALEDRPDVERHYWKQDDRGKWLQGP